MKENTMWAIFWCCVALTITSLTIVAVHNNELKLKMAEQGYEQVINQTDKYHPLWVKAK